RVPLEAAQELPLRPDRIFHDQAGIVRKEQGIRTPLLRAPAKLAGEVARIDGRRHLEASVAFDAVERLLVAPDPLRQAGLRPVTQLYAAVLADDSVALPLQDSLLLFIHPAPHEAWTIKGFRDGPSLTRNGPGVRPRLSVPIGTFQDRRSASLGPLVVFIEGVQAALSRFTGARSGDFGGLFQEVFHGMARLGFVEEKGGLPLVQAQSRGHVDPQFLVPREEDADRREE